MIDTQNRPYYLFWAGTRWLGTRLDCISASIIGLSVLCIVLLRHQISAGVAGVAINQVFLLTSYFQVRRTPRWPLVAPYSLHTVHRAY